MKTTYKDDTKRTNMSSVISKMPIQMDTYKWHRPDINEDQLNKWPGSRKHTITKRRDAGTNHEDPEGMSHQL